jgi:hypothetical protein
MPSRTCRIVILLLLLLRAALPGAVPEALTGERFETAGVHLPNNTLLDEARRVGVILGSPGEALELEGGLKWGWWVAH